MLRTLLCSDSILTILEINQRSPKNRGNGLVLHGGFEFKCQGDPDPDNEGSFTNRHVLFKLRGSPDDVWAVPYQPQYGLEGFNPETMGSNPETNDKSFDLGEGQDGLDANNPVCQICGKGPGL